MAVIKFLRDITGLFNWSTDEDPTSQQDYQNAVKNWQETEKNLVDAILWQPETEYAVGNTLKTPSLPSECVLVCTAAGISGATEPSYTGVDVGDTVVDGTVEWLVSGNLLTSGGTMTGAIKGNPLTLTADDGNDSADLVLNSSGSATWNGKEVERVNASGTGYIRLESGLQICWGSESANSDGTTATFPVAFINTPMVTVSNSLATQHCWISNPSTTDVILKNGGTTKYYVYYIAIGTWK